MKRFILSFSLILVIFSVNVLLVQAPETPKEPEAMFSAMSYVPQSVFVNPVLTEVNLGDIFDVSIDVNTTEEIWATSISVYYEPGMLGLLSTAEGNFLKQGGADTFVLIDNETAGRVDFDSTRLAPAAGATGEGSFLILSFQALVSGTTEIGIGKALVLRYPDLVNVTENIYNGTVDINTPPTVSGASLTPTTAYTNTLFTCIGSGKYDADGDPLTEYYLFKDQSGILKDWSPSNTYSCSGPGCDKGDSITCQYKVNDGAADSNVATSNSVVILNSPPVIDWFTPASPVTLREGSGSWLFIHGSSDPDEDLLTYSWLFDSVQKATTQSWLFSPTVAECRNHDIELVVSDGSLTDSQLWDVTVLLRGDVVIDYKVDIFDLASVGLAYGSVPGDPNWNPNADLNNDGKIDIFDLATVGLNYGRSC